MDIILSNLLIKFKKNEILSNINQKFPENKLIGLIGKSGSGKSSLFRAINGEIKYDGKISFFSNGKSFNYRDIKNKISYLRTGSFLLDNLTVKENFDIYSIKVEEVKEYFSQMELDEKLITQRIENLSKGENIRISLVVALVKNSEIVILDEPTSNLDSVNKKRIFRLLKEVSKKRLVIIASHDVEEVNEFCDIVYDIESKNLVEIFNKTKDKKPISFKLNNETNKKIRQSLILKYFLKQNLNYVLNFIFLGLLFGAGFGAFNGFLVFIKFNTKTLINPDIQSINNFYSYTYMALFLLCFILSAIIFIISIKSINKKRLKIYELCNTYKKSQLTPLCAFLSNSIFILPISTSVYLLVSWLLIDIIPESLSSDFLTNSGIKFDIVPTYITSISFYIFMIVAYLILELFFAGKYYLFNDVKEEN